MIPYVDVLFVMAFLAALLFLYDFDLDQMFFDIFVQVTRAYKDNEYIEVEYTVSLNNLSTYQIYCITVFLK